MYFFKNIIVVILLLFVVGCSSPTLNFYKEPLTNFPCCKTEKNHLLSQENSIKSELILKKCFDSRQVALKKQEVDAVLKITFEGQRKYNKNPDEKVYVFLDGSSYELNKVHTFSEVKTITNYHFIPVPGGGISIPKDITVRNIVFTIPYNLLSQITLAKDVRFILTDPHNKSLNALDSEALSFVLRPNNIDVISEFKTKCIDNNLKNKD